MKSKRSEEDTLTARKKVRPGALTVNLTGIRDGETIVGDNPNQTKGVEMTVKCKVPYYPIDVPSDELVRDQLKSVAFFSGMTFDERRAWLKANIRTYLAPFKENHLYDGENASLKVKFVKIESKYFTEKLGSEVIERLLKGNEEDEEGYWPILEIYELFRPKDKLTKANRHNLLLGPKNWTLKRMTPKCVLFNGTLLLRVGDTTELETTFNATRKNVEITNDEALCSFITPAKQEIGIIYSTVKPVEPLTRELLLQLASQHLTKQEYAECGEIVELIKAFTPSLYKSLMQKIVRSQCSFVTHNTKEYHARPFLLVTLCLLALHTGSFNVNKQRFVSGLESATKRLAIIICEDSHVVEMNGVSLLLVDAMLKQHDRAWMPPLAHFGAFFKLALEALASPRLFLYKTEKEHTLGEITWNEDKKVVPFKLNYVLLKEIGSMQGDINFFSDLALEAKVATANTNNQPITMSLCHCVDQHCFTTIAHFMPYDQAVEENSVAPFRALFSRIWKDVGSVNGRRDRARMLTMEEEPFVKQVRFAQSCVFQQKYTKNTTPLIKPAANAWTHSFSYRIDTSWLAGLVGVIEVKLANKGPSALVVMRTDDIRHMVVIRNPKSTRQAKDKLEQDLSQDEKEEAIELAKEQLRQGYPLKHVPGVLADVFKGAKVWLVDDVYLLEYADHTRVDWEDEATLISKEFEQYERDNEEPWPVAALRCRGSDCVATDCESSFAQLLNEYPMVVLKRLYMYLSNYRPTIKLYDIARDGSASKLDVALSDAAVHEILCAICVLYPACLELGSTCFEVKNGPLLWSLKDLIKAKIDEDTVVEMEIDLDAPYWAPIPGDTKTALFAHQQESVDEMIAKVEKGKRGHELFLDVGLGKTMICMAFIQYLVEKRKMPTYCVYAAPPSAIANAIGEFERYGIPYHYVVSKHGNTYKDSELEPYKINVLCHDQMRRQAVYASLKRHANELFFIVDEYHLASSGTTIRSSIALEISKLSRDFVAMTGTLVKSDNCSDLIPWLEQIVEFYVDASNYLVAFGALVSRKYSTGVLIEHESVMAPFQTLEEERYYAAVTPKLGGTANKFNFQAALGVCYEATDREMVKQILHYVKEKQEIVFVLAKSRDHQAKLKEMLGLRDSQVFLIDKDHSITLKPETKTKVKVVITTLLYVTGYTLTKIHTCITSIYPSNECTRHQFIGRLDRIGQLSKSISVISVHCGILTYLMSSYTKARSFAKSLKEFAEDVDADYALLTNQLDESK